MIRFSALVSLFVAAFLLFAAPQPARAAYPCPNGPGPGEVQVGVSGGSHGIAAVPMCESSGGGGDGGGGGVVYAFGSVAFHADADDVWMAGNRSNADTARRAALEACNRAMGGGCTSIGDWNNSSMTIMRDSQGGLWNGWDGQGGASRKRVFDECSSNQLLPCEILHSFGADRRRYDAPPSARKLYASAAWVFSEDFDGRLFIASGHASAAAADAAARAACTAATASAACRIASAVGNGVIQPYRRNGDTSLVVERTARRAAQAAAADCQRKNGRCTVQRSYDSRTPGQFVHDFNAAATK